MTRTHGYVLDTSVFIEAARRYYAFDLVPTFWRVLVDQAKKGLVCSVDRVLRELKRLTKSTDRTSR